MANTFYITTGLPPNDSGETNAANTFYISAGLVPDDVNILFPTIIAPIDGANNVTQPITFSWTSVTDALNYQLQVAETEAELDTSPIVDETITAPATTKEISGLDPATTYYARVRAQTP